MTIAQALKKYSAVEIELLLSHVLNKSKEFLYLHPQQNLTAAQTKRLSVLAKKRKSEMPVAYLLGYKYFYGIKFKVNRNVLIPRPESEWLVDKVLRLAKLKKTVRILEIGTGSGCIAVSIASNSDPKKVKVFATDISSKALLVAKKNAKANKAKINFSKHNLFTGVKGKFDIIIANLPYVPASDYKKLYGNLKYEPKLALTDGSDDFRLIKEFLSKVGSHVNKHGVVLLEFDPKTTHHLKKYKPEIHNDLQGLPRFAIFKMR